MKLSMEELVEFLQVTLSKEFFLEDDMVIEQLQASMTELRRAKLELPAPGTAVKVIYLQQNIRNKRVHVKICKVTGVGNG